MVLCFSTQKYWFEIIKMSLTRGKAVASVEFAGDVKETSKRDCPEAAPGTGHGPHQGSGV